jgi:lipoprotein-anchoring transpeptidase ErfK/SrfK
MIGLPAVALAACSSSRTPVVQEPMIDPYYQRMYGDVIGEPFPVAAMDLRRVDPKWWRQEVPYVTDERPGTIVVDTPNRFLYLVMEGGRALRYGVGVGKTEALVFRGNATIGRKAEWPRWTPTRSMINREPDRYGPYADGLPGGPTNPLGPRALYLYKNGADTLFRLHGTTEPYTIGTNVSSGCIRLMNQDIIDLYARVPTGTRVVVIN